VCCIDLRGGPTVHSALSEWLATATGKNAAKSNRPAACKQATTIRKKTSPQSLYSFASQLLLLIRLVTYRHGRPARKIKSYAAATPAKGPASRLSLLSPSRLWRHTNPAGELASRAQCLHNQATESRVREPPFCKESSRQVFPSTNSQEDEQSQWVARGGFSLVFFFSYSLHYKNTTNKPTANENEGTFSPSIPFPLCENLKIDGSKKKTKLEREAIANQFTIAPGLPKQAVPALLCGGVRQMGAGKRSGGPECMGPKAWQIRHTVLTGSRPGLTGSGWRRGLENSEVASTYIPPTTVKTDSRCLILLRDGKESA